MPSKYIGLSIRDSYVSNLESEIADLKDAAAKLNMALECQYSQVEGSKKEAADAKKAYRQALDKGRECRLLLLEREKECRNLKRENREIKAFVSEMMKDILTGEL